MNDDLISRSALKESIRKRLGISSLKYLTEQEKIIVDEIDNAPTVEQECYITGAQWDEFMKEHKRPKGEWKCTFHSSFPQYEPDEYRCSICNGRGGKLDKFCKHCGAKMKGGAE